MTAAGVQSPSPGALHGAPVGRTAIASLRLAAHWTTPWIWPARPPHDRGAAICAALVLAAGIAAVIFLGVRDSGRRPAPD